MPTRVALTLAGGVSLGAYQAGAVYELLWALSHQPAGAEPMVIDVITGASAGALTAAVVARALLCDRAAVEDLHRAWVREISFDRLTADGSGTSLLSGRQVRALADQIFHLDDEGLPAGGRPSAAPGGIPHQGGGAHLLLAFALSNLNGVNYRLGYPPGSGGFDTTVFSDWIAYSLEQGAPPERLPWRDIVHAAIASGAVPLAFPTVKVQRRLGDYEGSEVGDLEGTRGFTYVDGGLFNNEPVGLAREMVGRLEALEPIAEHDERVYILIDPFVAPNLAEPEYAEDPLGYRRLVGRLVSVVMGEASKRDWIRATRTNQRLRWQEELLQNLAAALAALSGPALRRCATSARALANDIAEFKTAYSAGGRPVPPDAVRAQFAPTVKRLGPGATAADGAYAKARRSSLCWEAFVDLAYAVENVAGLRGKTDLALHVIAPAPGSLAGDFLGNFGGFFDQAWREHDWRRGRADAREMIVDRLGLTYTLDAPEQYRPEADLSRLSERDVPASAGAGLTRSLRGGIANFLAPSPHAWDTGLVVRTVSGLLAALAVRLLMKRRSSCA